MMKIVQFLKELSHQLKKQRQFQKNIKEAVKKQNLNLKAIERPIIADQKLLLEKDKEQRLNKCYEFIIQLLLKLKLTLTI